MDNRNLYAQTQMQNAYYPYGYPAANAPVMRQEVPAFMTPQIQAPASLKGRPVASFEEARAAQIDLDGSISLFPDLGNKKIYTKKINPDGTASLDVYTLELKPIEAAPEYVTKQEMDELKATLKDLMSKLRDPIEKTQPTQQQKINF